MKITNNIQVEDFLAAIDKCKADVKMVSPFGDTYNLKSTFSRYLAIAALIADHGDEMELFCDDKNDEHFLFDFFSQHPEIMGQMYQ